MLRSLTKLDYLLRETWLGLRRGGWMNWAAVSTVTVLLFLFGVSLQASWQVEQVITQFGNQLEISVFLETGVSAQDVLPRVKPLANIRSIEAISKEQAWAELTRELGVTNQTATQQLEGNPLVDELRVQAQSAAAVPSLAAILKHVSGVETVQYVGEAVQQVGQLTQSLGWISLGITGFLSLSAIAVITTTLRLVIAARQQEVEVMRLVGATYTWIYLPFLLQGVTFGLGGAVLAWALLESLRQLLQQLFQHQGELFQALLRFQGGLTFLALPSILLLFGATIGLAGSLIAVRNLRLK